MLDLRLARHTSTYAGVIAIVAGALGAQQPAALRGIVVDSVTLAPVAGVHVSFVGGTTAGGRARTLETLTDSAGRFRIAAGASPARLELRHIGFAPLSITLDASSWSDTLLLAIVRTAARLDELHIVAKAGLVQRRLELAGFVERRKLGIGKFLDSTRIERTRATTLVSLLHPYLKGCTMIFVNGVPGSLRDVDIANVIGIEVYASNTEAPQQFRNPIESVGRCGSIVIWH